MYRDADNYKTHEEVVFAGVINTELIIEKIKEKLESFVPSQIGLEDLQERLQIFDSFDHDVDHCFHELCDVEQTNDEPTDERTIHEFTKELIGKEFIEQEVGHILNK